MTIPAIIYSCWRTASELDDLTNELFRLNLCVRVVVDYEP